MVYVQIVNMVLMPDWDVSQVTDMSNAFYQKSDFNADISSWDVK